MSISNTIKSLLALKGMEKTDLKYVLKDKSGKPKAQSVQSLSNKFREDRWFASELVDIADYTGCKLAFIFPDGERILFSSGSAPATPGGNEVKED